MLASLSDLLGVPFLDFRVIGVFLHKNGDFFADFLLRLKGLPIGLVTKIEPSNFVNIFGFFLFNYFDSRSMYPLSLGLLGIWC